MDVLIIEQRRGFAVEGLHEVDAVACDSAGRVVAQIGTDAPTTFRSAAKPFQLETSFGLLTDAQRALLTTRDLAVGAASHHGQAVHVAQVESLLDRLGRTPAHLYCGAHAPTDPESARAVYARGEVPSAVHNNCSGKHSFMAATCAAHGWPEDYRDSEHPLQQQILATMQKRTGNGVRGVVIDGCGVPCFVLGLAAMARAWAELARAIRDEPTSTLGRIGLAMREHPQLMSGTDAFDGWLIAHAPVVAKVGAQGLLCIAVPSEGVGIAIKSRSGNDVVRPAAARAVIERFFPTLFGEPIPERFTSVQNLVGTRVGENVAVWK